jgi:uncharacterized protein YndB with AHSA1/START domain
MIEISATIDASLQEVWDKWVSVEGVQHWAFASDDWAAEGIENDAKAGGLFKTRCYAKDGSFEFIFGGRYDAVEAQKHVLQTLDDGRKVEVSFEATPGGVHVTQLFEPETENTIEQQQEGWQAYLDNFKKYVEATA